MTGRLLETQPFGGTPVCRREDSDLRTPLAIVSAILLVGAIPVSAAEVHQRRLGKGYSWGRCLLTVGDRTLISGPCGYEIRKGGAFTINGPRQVYEGVDYRNAPDCGACQQSRDHWAVVYRAADGIWWGYANSDVRATHGDIVFRPLTKSGACLSGETDAGQTTDGEILPGKPVRICLWRR